jgi:hypothetical protein
MQQIADWLEKLGMPEYGECFAENKIDLSVLPHLTDQDLKDIGVPLGHRRKMLGSVQNLSHIWSGDGFGLRDLRLIERPHVHVALG